MLVLNLVDAVFTALWVYGGMAREANPLMASLLEGHPILFVATKLGLVGLGSHLLWTRRNEPLAVVAIFVAFVAYYAVLVLHLDALSRVLGHLFTRA